MVGEGTEEWKKGNFRQDIMYERRINIFKNILKKQFEY